MKTVITTTTTIDITSEVEAFEKAIESWRDEKADARTKKCYTADRRDLKKVLAQYRKGKFEEAGKLADRLDTIIRELIPQPAWDRMFP